MITVIKRDNTEDTFDINKIKVAITKAINDKCEEDECPLTTELKSLSLEDKDHKVATPISTNVVIKTEKDDKDEKDKCDDQAIQSILKDIENVILSRQAPFSIHIEEIQDIVERTLMDHKFFDLSKKYILYRNERNKRRNELGYDLYKIKEDVQPDFGSSFGYIVFKRTYARKIVVKECPDKKTGGDVDEVDGEAKTEEFEDTIKRILDGAQRQLGCGFTNAELKRAFYYMMKFKGLPAGRFIWQLNTSTVDKLGLMSLQNCAFIVADNISAFTWIFDNLMLGVGCGVNVQKHNIDKLPTITSNHIKITQENSKDADFIIPDSREGWVEVMKKVLEAFFVTGKSFSYSTILVRHKGEPIRGFGGTASGPQPLCDGINNICKILNTCLGKKLSSVDVIDICNIIGQIVCAGNIRRSAQIMLGDMDDIDYLKCKDWNTGEIPNWRCMSNNSIICNDINKLPEAYWDTFLNDSEVFGLVNLKLGKTVGRIKDGNKYPDPDIEGCNPCFSGETKIAVADGRVAVSIKELAEDGSDVPVYSLNKETGMIEIKMGRHPRITGYDKEMVKITLDNNTYLTTTTDHKFILNDGRTVLAKDLEYGMSLPRFKKELNRYTSDDNNQYIRVYTNTKNNKSGKIAEHRLIAQFHQPEKWNENYDDKVKHGIVKNNMIVHHKDYNSLNNSPDNLEIMTFSDHAKLHGECDQSGENNGMYGKKHSAETKKKIGEKTTKRFKDPEYANKFSVIMKKKYTDDQEYREASIANMKKVKKEGYMKWAEEMMSKTDLETILIDGVLNVKKVCETCTEPFTIPFTKREICYCSVMCSNKSIKAIEKRTLGKRDTIINKQKKTLHNQIMTYKDLQDTLGRDPKRKEWEAECKLRGVTYRIRNGKSGEHVAEGNDYIIKTYADLKSRAKGYNHRVKSVELLEKKETVYNITVDDNHTVAIATNKKNTIHCDGVLVPQCGEQQLVNRENCTLCELFLCNIESYEELKDIAMILYRICKHSMTLPCHHESTGEIVHKNMRMGMGVTGYMQSTEEQKGWLSDLYEYLREYDKEYSKKHGFPTSIKLTTCKPSGTISSMGGQVTPGCHPAIFKHYIRRMRISSDSPLIKLCKKNGYNTEYVRNFDGTEDKNTMILEFPCKFPDNAVLAKDVDCIRQLEVVKRIQNEWSDNAVSVTVYYKKDDVPRIREWLKENYNTCIKSVSFLLHYEHAFDQAPYEEITEERYEELIKNTKSITGKAIMDTFEESVDMSGECVGGVCPIR